MGAQQTLDTLVLLRDKTRGNLTEAEEQLGRLYGLWQERDGLEPMEAFRKFF